MAEKKWENTKALGVIFSLGATVAAGTVLGYWIGSFIDRKIGTEPWFTLAMVLLGAAAGFKSVYDIMVSDKGGE